MSSSRKRGRGRSKRRESENEAFEVNDEKSDDEVNTEKDDRSEEMPVTLPRSNEDETNICFSDDDEDTNVDFDMDTDEDVVRNEEKDGDGDTTGSPLMRDVKDVTQQDNDSSDAKKNDSSPNKHTAVADLEETSMDVDTENHVEEEEGQKKGGKQNTQMDVESRSSPPILNTGKINQVALEEMSRNQHN